MRNLEEYNDKYNNRTGIVIGGGFSIQFQDLSCLCNHITIAVNTGYCAYPEANFFLSDDWSVTLWSFFHDELKKSNTTVLLYEDKLFNFSKPFGDRAVLFRHRKGYDVSDIYAHEEYKNHLFECRTSVATAIGVLHIMGCSRVILLGVDCCRYTNGERYFWQFPHQPDGRIFPKRIDYAPLDKFKKRRIKGKRTDSDLIDIQRYWENNTKDMRKKINIYNASEYSELTIFPKVKIQDI